MHEYIFSYGSLVNTFSRNNSLRRSRVIPVMVHENFGYTRKWNTKSNKTHSCVLGLTKNEAKNTKINGLLIRCTPTIKQQLELRETSYKKIQIVSEFIIPYNQNDSIPKNIIVHTFIPLKRQESISIKCNTSQSYIDMVVLGFLEYGEKYAKMMYATTQDWDSNMDTYAKWKSNIQKRIHEIYVTLHYFTKEYDMKDVNTYHSLRHYLNIHHKPLLE